MPMYAIIEAGSKQYRVEPNAIIEVEKMALPENPQEVSLEKVLLFRDGDNVQIGLPWIEGAKVVCGFLGNHRSPKVISLKYRRRKASRKKHGHRQELLRLIVKEIKLQS